MWKVKEKRRVIRGGFQVLLVTPSGGELLLASCSQDCLIRVWRLCPKSGTDAPPEDEHAVIKMKEDVFEVKERGERSIG